MFIRFDINGAGVILKQEFLRYNGIRKEFVDLSTYLENLLMQDIDNEVLESKFSFDNYINFSDICIANCIKKAIEIIVGYGIVTVDRDTFIKEYYTEHVNYKSEISNLIKNASKSYKKGNIVVKKDDINKFINTFMFYTYKLCLNTHFTLVDVLVDNGVDVIAPYPTLDDINKANALFNNYKDGFIAKTDECEVVKKMILLNPYREDMYRYLIKEDGDFNNEIERLVQFLGYEVSEYKHELLDEYVNKVIVDFGDEKLREVVKEKINKYSLFIGLTFKEEEIEDIIDSKVNLVTNLVTNEELS